jgi:hypothetical protein
MRTARRSMATASGARNGNEYAPRLALVPVTARVLWLEKIFN